MNKVVGGTGTTAQVEREARTKAILFPPCPTPPSGLGEAEAVLRKGRGSERGQNAEPASDFEWRSRRASQFLVFLKPFYAFWQVNPYRS